MKEISLTDNKNRKFTGMWIPAEVYLDNRISWEEKILYSEIKSFRDNGNECFFSNENIAAFLGKSISAVHRYIQTLKNIGYIKIYFKDNQRYFENTRYLKNINTEIIEEEYEQRKENKGIKNDTSGVSKMICRGIKNDIHNSTVKNTDTKYSTASKLTVSNQKNKPVLRNEDITKKLLSFWNKSPFTTNHIFNPESKIIKK